MIRMLFCLSFLLASSVFAEDKILFSTQTTWLAAAADSNWLTRNREHLLDSTADNYKKGGAQSVAKKNLGNPQSVWTVDGTNVWTYGLYNNVFFHIVFDNNERVSETAKSSYQRFSNDDLSRMTNIPVLASAPYFDICSWKAIRQHNSGMLDCMQIAAGAARVLFPEMPAQDVDVIFGKADDVTERQHQTILTYRLGYSDFLQISILNKKELLGAQVRHYNMENGRLNIIPLCGVIEKRDDPVLDEACWRATFPEGQRTNIRTGIGIRMMYLVPKGMTQQEVLKRLGPPYETSTQDQAIVLKYFNSHESMFHVVFNRDGITEQVRLLNTPSR